MRIIFLGVGAAFDEKHTNISMVLEVAGKNILLDCGYSVPHALWKHNSDPEYIDAVWISHLHADHYFGLGPYIRRLREDGRKKKLTILSGQGIKDDLEMVTDISYPGNVKKSEFPIEFIEFEHETTLDNISITIAPTEHSIQNKAIRIEANDKSFCYSGDGQYTSKSEEMFKGCNLLVHETFTLDENIKYHGNIKDVVRMAREIGAKKLAIAHIHRNARKNESKITEFLEGKDVLMPKEGDFIDL